MHSSYSDSVPVNDSLLTLLQRYNALDIALFNHARAIFCARWRRAALAEPCVREALAANLTRKLEEPMAFCAQHRH